MKTGIVAAFALMAALAGCRTNETPEQQAHDIEIVSSVKSELAKSLGPSSVTNISVNSTNGVVTLAGTVDTTAQKAKAVAVAGAVPKVVRVNDDLQVTSSPPSS
jgi:hyperosmotically inducible periplasmic protein